MPPCFSTAAMFSTWLVGMLFQKRARGLSTRQTPHHWFQSLPGFAHLKMSSNSIFPFPDLLYNFLKVLVFMVFSSVFYECKLRKCFLCPTSCNIPTSFISPLISTSLVCLQSSEKFQKLYGHIPSFHENNLICWNCKLQLFSIMFGLFNRSLIKVNY